MPSGGELKIEATPLTSTLLDGSKQNFVKVVVSDTGKGIPPLLVQKIFDPFFTTKPKGSG